MYSFEAKITMKAKSGLIIFLLSFALFIQNTCPYGMAGKSSVASTACGDCPFKHSVVLSQDSQNTLVTDSSTVHLPHYIFEASDLVRTVRISPVASDRPLLADDYHDALPDELLQPPRS